MRTVTGGAALAALLIAGCSATEQMHTPPRLLVRDKSPPGLPAPTDLFGDTRKSGKPVASPQAEQPDAQSLSGLFLADYGRSVARRDDPVLARAMLKSGFTVIETRCDLFFESIGRGSQRFDIASRQLATLSTALVAVLGLTGAGEAAVAGVGVASALGLQMIRNYTDVYFFSPDVALVHDLVRKAFAEVRGIAQSPDQGPTDFDSAINFLRRQQNICTAHEIKALVNGAIRTTKIEASIDDRGKTGSPALQSSLGMLARQLDVPTVPLEQLGLLARLADKATPPIESAAICQLLDPALADRLCGMKNGEFTGTVNDTPAFEQIRSTITYLRGTDQKLIDDLVANGQKRVAPSLAKIAGLNARLQEQQSLVSNAATAAEKQAAQAKTEALRFERDSAVAEGRQTIVPSPTLAAPAQPSSIEIKVVGSD